MVGGGETAGSDQTRDDILIKGFNPDFLCVTSGNVDPSGQRRVTFFLKEFKPGTLRVQSPNGGPCEVWIRGSAVFLSQEVQVQVNGAGSRWQKKEAQSPNGGLRGGLDPSEEEEVL